MGITLSIIILLLMFGAIAGVWFVTPKPLEKYRKYAMSTILTLGMCLVYVGNSFVNVSSDNIATFEKFIGGPPLSGGRVVASDGEMGPQAWYVREGYFQHHPLVYLTHNSSEVGLVEIPQNAVGVLYARDGEQLSKDQFFANDWYDSYTARLKKGEKPRYTRKQYEQLMLNPSFFLENGGEKGPQYTVLKPGKHVVSPVLWKVTLAAATKIEPGHSGVVISRVGKIYDDIELSASGTSLATPLVPKGYIGVRKDVLTTGNYYFNPEAIKVQEEDMRAQVWTYKGCYTPREVVISVDGETGQIVQSKVEHSYIDKPTNAADCAVAVKTKDKNTIYVELRLQIQPDPSAIAGIVASVGSIAQVEDKTVTPAVRSVLRNLGERYNAIEFVTKRSVIEKEFRDAMVVRTASAGVPAKEAYLANIDLPPAVVIPGKIKELASKMESAYVAQQQTYAQLVETNKTKAEADQQSELVSGLIANQKADELKEARVKVGEGEEGYLRAIARGNKAMKDVYGQEKAYQLQIVREMFELCKEQPTVCNNVPLIYSTGGSDSQMLESFGALGLQNIMKAGQSLGKNPVVK